MFAGFNLTADLNNLTLYSYLLDYQDWFSDNTARTIQALKSKLFADQEVIDGSQMQEDWFPQVNADIFISHSHADEDNAKKLAYWLWDNFKIKAFIDSCLWGCSNDLLNEIDRKHCKCDDGYYFDYQKRNQSTSHVHMMLSVALNKMIDKTECLFFLNTPHSISCNEVKEKTRSPWIYNEIAMSEIIRRRRPTRLTLQKSAALESLDYSAKMEAEIEYELPTQHLQPITMEGLENWANNCHRNGVTQGNRCLDELYRLHGFI